MTDDTVLEEHSEDPSLVQMRLLGDGGKHVHKTYNIIHNYNQKQSANGLQKDDIGIALSH